MDLIYVTYNSSKWIDSCFASVINSNFDHTKINIYVVDNASTDDTLAALEKARAVYGPQVNHFEVIASDKNLGFGRGNNLGFSKGSSDIACFLNIDTELCADTLQKLADDIAASPEDVALWELRQFPYEHPKLYDPLTMEQKWSSGAAFAVRRTVFAQLNGFDDHIFMYAEDVDLSWRLRSFGYKIRYVPKAVIYHYSYQEAGEVKPTQYINSIINNLLLRYRFGSLRKILGWHKIFLKILKNPRPFPRAGKMLLRRYLWHFTQIPHYLNRRCVGTCKDFTPDFLGLDYTINRMGAFYVNELPKTRPLVSILVRTCGRPDVLRETLISIRNQTYPHIETVVVEDGKPVSQTMIQTEFSDMNILYHATGEKVGRSAAGNLAMEMAHGQYLNFLDDDDLFFADHVEVLVHTLEKGSQRAAYALGFETPIEVKSRSPYVYEVKDYLSTHTQSFSRGELYYHNYIPIQCIMFEKSLFEEYGGLDITLDALEDWNLWVRYSLHTDFAHVAKTTSLYRTPANRQADAARQKALDEALSVVREKHKSYIPQLSAYDIGVLYHHM